MMRMRKSWRQNESVLVEFQICIIITFLQTETKRKQKATPLDMKGRERCVAKSMALHGATPRMPHDNAKQRAMQMCTYSDRRTNAAANVVPTTQPVGLPS